MSHLSSSRSPSLFSAWALPSLTTGTVLRFGGLALAALLGGGWLFGLVRFVVADGTFEARLPRRLPPPAELHNLAAHPYGPLVRASSYGRSAVRHHHPYFLVDGRSYPTLEEKWTSSARDRQPWVEIHWREPRRLERVVLRHAGAVEGSHYTLRRYTVTCLRGEDHTPGPRHHVRNNRSMVAVHLLPCADARGVRIDAQLGVSELVRLFEIEAWGQ